MQKLFKSVNVQKAILFLALLIILIILIELNYFISGFLGAIMLYVITRKFYQKLTVQKNWNENLAITLIIFLIIITFAVPFWILLEILIPKVNEFVNDREGILEKYNAIRVFLENNEFLKRFNITVSNEQILQVVNKVISYVPSTLNWVGQTFGNIFVALFILYFMLKQSEMMEQKFKEILPVSRDSKKYFIHANAALIRSNAYGVPVLGLSQGIIAMIGYFIFGIDNAIFWGLLTGAASIVPVVGTMLIYVPIAIYHAATGDVTEGLILGAYCLTLVGGIDNVLRFTLLKKTADIHPLITVFGVILGLQIFGVMGLIFGPVLLSLPGILYRVFEMERSFKNQEEHEKEELQHEEKTIQDPESM